MYFTYKGRKYDIFAFDSIDGSLFKKSRYLDNGRLFDKVPSKLPFPKFHL